MAGPKIMVMYPRPTDVAVFERAYLDEHMPMVREKITGFSRVVMTRVIGTPGRDAPFHLIVEIHFDSMDALQRTLASPGMRETATHAMSISSGGSPVFMVTEEYDVDSQGMPYSG
jgi:uncharacterized protein (TIGR02118 family)